ncbi:MAG: B12-binding domain-containing radical SAM protein [bacterium]
MSASQIALAMCPVFWPAMPPLSLAYLKGFLKKKKIEAECLDLNHFFFTHVSPAFKDEWRKSCSREFEKNILDLLRMHCPAMVHSMIERLLHYDIIGFSCYKSNCVATQQIARILKKNKPDMRILLGGPEITACYFKWKENITEKFGDCADFIVVGEGEAPLFDYVIEKNNPSPSIALFQELDDADELGSPDFNDFELASYPKKGAISLMLSRGCIRRCQFCAERLLYKKFRLYSVETIIQQITSLTQKGISTFIFHDSLINGDLFWLDRLCDAFIENCGSIKWEAQMAIRKDMSEALLRKMKRSGCYHLFVGLESGSRRTLKQMNKGYTPVDALHFFKKLNDAGLSFGISMLIGFPGETQEDFMKSLQFVIDNKAIIPKIEQVNPFVYYEGIPFKETSDYKDEPESLRRAQLFIERIKQEGIKHTNAFLLNLVEPEWK